MTQDITRENIKKLLLEELEEDKEFNFKIQRLLGIDDIESKIDEIKN
ncbi:MAG: hypothetical protein PF569_05860 [Candidatus Woesearchaeota archaeon]|jgi:hypothetical protein|nr:hypothetical protein [Candidatus Woesearchaeota archaeon]